ncbi:hypothetical protein [Dysgonomonas sp. 520]|uniref:hypothetical protein n=1 Tax=Dysgonomonas sp. 520 TaxID=2302931 RepID=UPI0013D71EA6|nr:hypothetical protein [Dysgonomonas sp. 520]NDW10360.1 hypothetical protein [Dysgonomonas sp. 520]
MKYLLYIIIFFSYTLTPLRAEESRFTPQICKQPTIDAVIEASTVEKNGVVFGSTKNGIIFALRAENENLLREQIEKNAPANNHSYPFSAIKKCVCSCVYPSVPETLVRPCDDKKLNNNIITIIR